METNPGYKNPMRPSDDQERTVRGMSQSELNWLASRPFFLRFPEHNLLAVHAGVLPGIPVERQTKEVLAMVRYIDETSHRKMIPFLMPGFRQPPGSVPWTDVYDRPEHIVYGHHVHSMTEPFVVEHSGAGTCYGIDTGCVFGGRLTAAIFHDTRPGVPEFVQVDAAREYYARADVE
jgi:diadenosine tetraphosphatase ApaH/serine/threonine PP2A family protein phosphatase